MTGRPDTCANCGRTMWRGKRRPPGIPSHSGRGLCSTCWQRLRRAGEAADARTPARLPPLVHAWPPPPAALIDNALCAQTDPEIFFPEQGGSVREAKAVCARRPVQTECLDYALAIFPAPLGIWGGTTERARRAMSKETAA